MLAGNGVESGDTMESGMSDADALTAAVSRFALAFDNVRSSFGVHFGLSSTALKALGILSAGPQQAGRLAETLALTSGGLTATVDRLEERGFVTRHASRDDRRTVLIRITDDGREVAAWAAAQLRQALVDALPGDDPDGEIVARFAARATESLDAVRSDGVIEPTPSR